MTPSTRTRRIETRWPWAKRFDISHGATLLGFVVQDLRDHERGKWAYVRLPGGWASEYEYDSREEAIVALESGAG